MPGGDVHVSWVPVADEGAAGGYLVLIHDFSFVDRRASTIREALFVSFGLVGLAAAVATLLARELGRDEAWRDAQVDAFRKLAAGYLVA